MDFTGVTMGFALTGSFCTFDLALEQMRALKNLGARIIPIFSYNTDTLLTRFISGDELKNAVAAITSEPIVRDLVSAEPFGPQKVADIVLIAPCTGNSLAKLANGITDTPVLMCAKGTMRNNRPVVLAIASNDGLGANAVNIGKLLAARNVYFVPFGQDGPDVKTKSLQSNFAMIPDALAKALSGVQMEPVVLGADNVL